MTKHARVFALLAVVLLLCSSLHAADARPNVLLLIGDDWRWDTLSCAGHPIVKTPNLDALAANGVRFANARVTTSICGVSRASMLTGQWMSRHGNKAFNKFDTPWSETYPGVMRDAGYYTGHVGKWHCGPLPAAGFDWGEAYSGKHVMNIPRVGPVHVTEKNNADAIDFLRDRPADRPFCLTVAFFAVHAEDNNPKQFIYQPSSENWYKDVTIPTPKLATKEAFDALPPFISSEKNEGRIRWHWRFDTPDKFQQYMKAYYRMVTEADRAVGDIVAELKAQGVFDHTLILFIGDNGMFLGDRGLADKWYPYEESLRVPLIVVDPRLSKSKRGMTRDEFALNVDLAPTMLSAAGLQLPPRMQGKDLSPLYLSEPPPTWRQEFFYEHAIISSKQRIPASEALVRKDWKYVRWPDYDYEQLFDLKSDPDELHNLIKDSKQAEKLLEMKKRFEELREAAK